MLATGDQKPNQHPHNRWTRKRGPVSRREGGAPALGGGGIPPPRGGATVRNIELRCEKCNRSKGSRIDG